MQQGLTIGSPIKGSCATLIKESLQLLHNPVKMSRSLLRRHILPLRTPHKFECGGIIGDNGVEVESWGYREPIRPS